VLRQSNLHYAFDDICLVVFLSSGTVLRDWYFSFRYFQSLVFKVFPHFSFVHWQLTEVKLSCKDFLKNNLTGVF